MDISEFAVRLLLIFFPGIIATMVIDLLTSNKKREMNRFFLNSFVLGMASYFVHYTYIQVINYLFGYDYEVHFLDFLVDSKTEIIWVELVWTTIASFFIGILLTYAINHRWMHNIALRLNMTKKFAESDVWGFIFNSKDAKWVLVRDYEKEQMYEGWVEAYSDTHNDNELLIRDVYVYNMGNSVLLYQVEGLYISKTNNNLMLEFRTMR